MERRDSKHHARARARDGLGFQQDFAVQSLPGSAADCARHAVSRTGHTCQNLCSDKFEHPSSGSTPKSAARFCQMPKSLPRPTPEKIFQKHTPRHLGTHARHLGTHARHLGTHPRHLRAPRRVPRQARSFRSTHPGISAPMLGILALMLGITARILGISPRRVECPDKQDLAEAPTQASRHTSVDS